MVETKVLETKFEMANIGKFKFYLKNEFLAMEKGAWWQQNVLSLVSSTCHWNLTPLECQVLCMPTQMTRVGALNVEPSHARDLIAR